MKKKLKNSWLLLCFISLSCTIYKHPNQELINTKWSCDFGYKDDELVSYVLFKDTKNYSFYNGENGDITIGTYFYKNDTIHFYQECSIFDEDFPENSRHRQGKMEYKMLIRNKNQLGFMELWDNDAQKWKEDYFFTKE
jgi:hypothetical protein